LHITINRAELLAAARRMTAVASPSSPLDVLKGVLLEADTASQQLTLTATNLELSLEEKLTCAVSEDDALVIGAGLLAGMLEKLPDDTVEIIRQGARPVVSLKSGLAGYAVPVWAHASFPKPELPFPEDTIKVGGIQDMAKRTVFAVSTDNDKPLMRCVNLMFTPNGLQAVGSDGSCIVTAKGDEQSVGNISLLVPASSLEKLSRITAGKDEFCVGTTGKNIVFFKENFLFSARIMEGEYINTNRLLSMIQNSFTVLTDVPDLRRALYAVLSVGADGKISLTFNGSRLTFRCVGADANATASVEVIPMTGTPQGEFWYSARRLVACLRALSGTVTLGVSQGGMLTINTQDAFYLQNAMRPPSAKTAESPERAA